MKTYGENCRWGTRSTYEGIGNNATCSFTGAKSEPVAARSCSVGGTCTGCVPIISKVSFCKIRTNKNFLWAPRTCFMMHLEALKGYLERGEITYQVPPLIKQPLLAPLV